MSSSVGLTIGLLRRALLLILVVGCIGIAAELLLLKHTDGIWQLIPLGLIATTLLVVGWYAFSKGRSAIRALQGVMLLCLVAGGVGVVQHFRGNMVYASESNPSISGRELYIEAILGSTPALAPGAMVQLGLIGLAFAFRHPGLRGLTREDDNSPERISS